MAEDRNEPGTFLPVDDPEIDAARYKVMSDWGQAWQAAQNADMDRRGRFADRGDPRPVHPEEGNPSIKPVRRRGQKAQS